MTLISFVNFGIAAMTGLLLNIGSVGVSTMNQTVASAEAVESKGCAANICPLGTLPFFFNSNNYSTSNVEDVNRWTPGYNPTSDCVGDEVACLICIGEDFVEGEGTSMQIKPTLLLESSLTGIDQAKIIGSNDPLFHFSNENL